MATCFDRWEKDPFFAAAEEVQESADRLESIYREWIQESTATFNPSGELRRDLQTALGTAKWQLEELERAVRSSDEVFAAGDDTRARHRDFILAIGSRILGMEDSLKKSNLDAGESELSWVRLDEGERVELALFLSGSSPTIGEQEGGSTSAGISGETSSSGSKSSWCSSGSMSKETKEEVFHDHSRMDNVSTDAGEWKCSIPRDNTSPASLLKAQPNTHLSKMVSFSGLTNFMGSSPEMKWSKYGIRKWKGRYQHDSEQLLPVHSHQFGRGMDACYERSKSCLSSCEEEVCDKQIYGWAGAFNRQLQRSQYQLQYGRPIQLILLAILAIVLIAFVAIRAV